VLTDELRLPMYRGNPNPLSGHCYIASEALFYLADKKLKPMFIKHEGKSHWFLKDANGRVIDLTSSQFKNPVPYHKAVGKGFLTNKPSKRAQILIQRVHGYG
jgi:hypothetical protein